MQEGPLFANSSDQTLAPAFVKRPTTRECANYLDKAEGKRQQTRRLGYLAHWAAVSHFENGEITCCDWYYLLSFQGYSRSRVNLVRFGHDSSYALTRVHRFITRVVSLKGFGIGRVSSNVTDHS